MTAVLYLHYDTCSWDYDSFARSISVNALPIVACLPEGTKQWVQALRKFNFGDPAQGKLIRLSRQNIPSDSTSVPKLTGDKWLMASLMYGAKLRVKVTLRDHVDFWRNCLTSLHKGRQEARRPWAVRSPIKNYGNSKGIKVIGSKCTERGVDGYLPCPFRTSFAQKQTISKENNWKCQ